MGKGKTCRKFRVGSEEEKWLFLYSWTERKAAFRHPEERVFEGNWGRVLAARRPRRPCGQDGPARGAWNARAELRTLLGPVGLGEGVRTGMTDKTGQKILFF